MLQDDINDNLAIGANGAEAILNMSCRDGTISILTHCNTGSLVNTGYGSILSVIRKLHELNRLEHVYCTETRPHNQKTLQSACKLFHNYLPSTLILDSTVTALLQSKNITAVVVAADMVSIIQISIITIVNRNILAQIKCLQS